VRDLANWVPEKAAQPVSVRCATRSAQFRVKTTGTRYSIRYTARNGDYVDCL
jgi:hypothetical protein